MLPMQVSWDARTLHPATHRDSSANFGDCPAVLSAEHLRCQLSSSAEPAPGTPVTLGAYKKGTADARCTDRAMVCDISALSRDEEMAEGKEGTATAHFALLSAR